MNLNYPPSFPVAISGAICLSVIAALLWTTPARADAIDGDWCSKLGKRLTIDGPKIVTPGGTKMTGSYDRHGFIYRVPPAEKGAGTIIEMSQVDEETMLLRRKPPGATVASLPETWGRCGVTS